MFKVNNKDSSGPLQFMLIRKFTSFGKKDRCVEIIGPPAENRGPKTKEN